MSAIVTDYCHIDTVVSCLLENNRQLALEVLKGTDDAKAFFGFLAFNELCIQKIKVSFRANVQQTNHAVPWDSNDWNAINIKTSVEPWDEPHTYKTVRFDLQLANVLLDADRTRRQNFTSSPIDVEFPGLGFSSWVLAAVTFNGYLLHTDNPINFKNGAIVGFNTVNGPYRLTTLNPFNNTERLCHNIQTYMDNNKFESIDEQVSTVDRIVKCFHQCFNVTNKFKFLVLQTSKNTVQVFSNYEHLFKVYPLFEFLNYDSSVSSSMLQRFFLQPVHDDTPLEFVLACVDRFDLMDVFGIRAPLIKGLLTIKPVV